MNKWKTVSSKTICRDQWINLRADEVQLVDGKRISPYYVLEESDWVHVIALDSNNKVLITAQYRYAANQVCLEIPCGGIEGDEKPLDAAKRELLEETGYQAENWELIATPFANPARQTNRVFVFLAKSLKSTGEQNLDETEEIVYTFITLEEVFEKIQSGEFNQALHIASLFLTLNYIDGRTSRWW